MRRQNQARRRPTSPASSSCRCRWVDVIFLSVTEALMQHLKTLFFTSSCPLWLRRTAIVSQNAGFEIGLHARPSSDPSSLNHPNYKEATLQDSWPYSCVKTKIQKKEGEKKISDGHQNSSKHPGDFEVRSFPPTALVVCVALLRITCALGPHSLPSPFLSQPACNVGPVNHSSAFVCV